MNLRPIPVALLFLASAVALSAAHPKFQTLLTSRYLMPIVPLLFACAALALVTLAETTRRRQPASRRRPLLAVLLIGIVLVALPTLSWTVAPL